MANVNRELTMIDLTQNPTQHLLGKLYPFCIELKLFFKFDHTVYVFNNSLKPAAKY